MHEKSVMDSVMRAIEQLAQDEKVKKITVVRVRLGALSHMSKEHFQEHFTIAAKGTIAENAVVEAEVSEDLNDPGAKDILIRSIDVAT